jgi:hypothetical protein
MIATTYFEPAGVRVALASYAVWSQRIRWPIPHKLELYNYAKTAFEGSNEEPIRRDAFHRIYYCLSLPGKNGWNVFRNCSSHWNADRIFDVLSEELKPFSRKAGMTLTSLKVDDYEPLLRSIRGLHGLKEVSDPTMAISKFLHFFNPMLFPIWDGDIVYKEIVGPGGCFHDEYWTASRKLQPSWLAALPKDKDYYLRYLAWARSLIIHGGQPFMSYFAGWFKQQVINCPDPESVVTDLNRYEATAYEFTVIGAAMLA